MLQAVCRKDLLRFRNSSRKREGHSANVRCRVYRKQIGHFSLIVAMLDATRSPELLNVDRAIDRLLALARPVTEVETVALRDATGRISAEEILAPCDLPPFNASAMDGYAVSAAGANNNRVKRFRVVDESLAGHPATCAVSEGTAVRIFTGAVLPTGADAVLLQEEVTVRGEFVSTAELVRHGQHVRRRGHDIASGTTLCAAHTKLSAYHATWLAACGIATVRVKRRVRVAVASTGDELAPPGKPLQEGQIYDSNRFAVSTLLGQKACDTIDLGCLPDDPAAVGHMLSDAARQADMIVTSGGVSVGDADFVKNVIAALGEVEFWRIAMKPGKPLTVGRIDQALVIGLPGNPVSTIVTYLLFVAPAVDKIGGAPPPAPLILPARLEFPVRHTRGRREYMRGNLRTKDGELLVRTTGDQSSNRLSTFANANCLVVVDENASDIAAGEFVGVIPLHGEAAHLLSG